MMKHVCMDEYLRTEALAESNSKKGIVEPPLLQVRMRNTSFLLIESLNKNPLSSEAYLGICQAQKTVVRNEALYLSWFTAGYGR